MRVVQADGLWFAIAKILASLGCAMAWSLPSLMIARALQGLGASAVMAANVALIRFIYPSDKLGRGIGLNALVVSSLSNTAAVAGLASQHLNSAQRRGVARIASVENFGHAIGNWGRLGWRHRFSARRTKHDRRLACMFEHRRPPKLRGACSTNPDRKRRMTKSDPGRPHTSPAPFIGKTKAWVR
jgi:hypothetical protein